MGLKLVKHLFVKTDIHEENIIVQDYIYLGYMWNPINYTFNNYYVFIDENGVSYLVNQSWVGTDIENKKAVKELNRFANLHIHSQINLAYISSKKEDEKKEEIQHLISSFNANTSYSSDLEVTDIIDDFSICVGYKRLVDGQIKSRNIIIPNEIIYKIQITNYNITTLTPIIENLDSDRYKNMDIYNNIDIKFLFFDKTFWTEDDNIVIMVYELSHPNFKDKQYALVRVTMPYNMVEKIKSNSNLYDFSKYHKGCKFIDMGNNRLSIFTNKIDDRIDQYAGFHYIDRIDKNFKIYITNISMDKLLRQVLI